MDGNAFDNWTRTRATAANRRKVLGWSLTAGLGAALARVLPAGAQFGDAETCTYEIELNSSVTAGAVATGILTFDVGADGAIETGSLTLEGQAAAPVVGQATGLAVDLLASLADGSLLSLTGVAGGPIGDCPKEIDGFLANAGTAQLGTWRATTDGSSGASTSGSQSGQSQSGQSQSGSSSSGSGSQSTCPPRNCGDAFVLDQQSCECVCASGTVPCGPNCCPSGSSCTDSGAGICGCPGGTVQCGTSCVNECSGDDVLDLDTCQCVSNQEPACTDLGGACANGGQCCSGWCNAGTCDSCGLRVCNDLCVDTSSDNNNCGNCNNMCIGTTCQNGSCQ